MEHRKNIDRKEFIKKVGGATAFAFLFACTGGCTKMDNPPVPHLPNGVIDFTIDLSLPENSALQMNGGYVIVNNNYVVAKDENGQYIAATRSCSHEPYKEVVWYESTNEWVCMEHGASFDKSGNGTTTNGNNYGEKGLTIYSTELISPELLRIYG